MNSFILFPQPYYPNLKIPAERIFNILFSFYNLIHLYIKCHTTLLSYLVDSGTEFVFYHEKYHNQL